MIPSASPVTQYVARQEAIQAAIMRVLDSGVYVLGPEVEAFERAFANYCGVGHGVGVGSGTDALILALRALSVGPGDEVVTVSHTAIATGAAILATGATPVLIDIEPTHYTMDPKCIERALTPRSKALIAVHLYGQTADMTAILSVTEPSGLPVIEDCAQAAGGGVGDRRAGSLGDLACFSFYPTKNLGAIGDAGMVVTDDGELAARLRRLRQYGWDADRQTHECGLNSRLDPLQAAVLRAKLPHLDEDNARRAALAERFGRGLAGLPVVLPVARRQTTHVYHLYVIGCEECDHLRAHLAKDGIGSAVHYPAPIHRHGGYAERVILPQEGLPVTERLIGRIVSIPMFPELSDADADRIITSIRGFFGRRGA